MTAEDTIADIRRTVETLRGGGIILYPTDTIWGIGCDARNEDAVKRIYDLKQRSDAKALICLVDSIAMLERTVGEIPDAAEQLIEVAVEPLTIVYDHGIGVAPNLLAEDGSLGVRLTHARFPASLCRGLRAPVVSTSANISGRPAPADFSSIDPQLLKAVDYVCLTGRSDPPAARASTVIKVSRGGLFKILRK